MSSVRRDAHGSWFVVSAGAEWGMLGTHILLLIGALLAVVCVRDAWSAADDAPTLRAAWKSCQRRGMQRL